MGEDLSGWDFVGQPGEIRRQKRERGSWTRKRIQGGSAKLEEGIYITMNKNDIHVR